MTFPNPIGLAAGFDKNGLALPAWEALGFGFIEIGTVTAKAQPGNPKPRIFRFPRQQALINRLGFNNDGADIVANRLRRWQERGRWPKVPVGINIGKSRITPLDQAPADYLHSFRRLQKFADYIVLNVSSPNTPGLRSLQEQQALATLLRAVRDGKSDAKTGAGKNFAGYILEGSWTKSLRSVRRIESPELSLPTPLWITRRFQATPTRKAG